MRVNFQFQILLQLLSSIGDGVVRVRPKIRGEDWFDFDGVLTAEVALNILLWRQF